MNPFDGKNTYALPPLGPVADLVKVIKQRMQVHGSTYSSIAQCARSLYRSEGLSTFYVSYPTTLCMTVPFTATQFMAYESLSRVMNPRKEYDPISHCVAGGLAGAFAAGLTTPLDAIKTLLQTRGLSEQADIKKVRGLLNAAAIIKRQYGWRGFFRGLKPRIITTMPSTAICWFVALCEIPLFPTSAFFTDMLKVII
jgi:solute carrier family 25 iron transporter 28/37